MIKKTYEELESLGFLEHVDNVSQQKAKVTFNKASNHPNILKRRFLHALELRANGLSYKAIGSQIGCSASRAKQIVCEAVFDVETCVMPDAPCNAQRIIRHLVMAGFDTKAKIVEGIKTGDIHPTNQNVYSYGQKSHQIICDWLGLKVKKRS